MFSYRVAAYKWSGHPAGRRETRGATTPLKWRYIARWLALRRAARTRSDWSCFVPRPTTRRRADVAAQFTHNRGLPRLTLNLTLYCTCSCLILKRTSFLLVSFKERHSAAMEHPIIDLDCFNSSEACIRSEFRLVRCKQIGRNLFLKDLVCRYLLYTPSIAKYIVIDFLSLSCLSPVKGTPSLLLNIIDISQVSVLKLMTWKNTGR